jgi:alpha-tubulin suppressor-like RCC1 family protein
LADINRMQVGLLRQFFLAQARLFAAFPNAVAIAAFGYDAMALRTNGTVEVWGSTNYGATNVPAGLSNVVSVAAGGFEWLALQAPGTVVEWGEFGYTNVPAGLNAVKAISAGLGHSLAIQSGLLAPVIFQQPANQFATNGGTVTFSAQGQALAGVQYQWQYDGVNVNGATNATLTLTDTQLANNGSYDVVISTSGGAITSSIATFSLVLAPQIVSTTPPAPSTNWISGGYSVLSASVYAAGQSQYPVHYQWQFNGTNLPLATDSLIEIFPTNNLTEDGNYTLIITNAAGGTNITWNIRCALPGVVIPWGSDGSGECNQTVALTNAIWIAAGDYHSTAVTETGTIVQWGEYFDGALVSPASSGTNYYVSTAAGMDHDIGLLRNGKVVTWGCSSAYANYVPARVTNAKAVACGWYHNVALLTNGSVVAWGINEFGLTNVPSDLTTNNAVTAIAASYVHSLALRANGTVEAWGYNGDGETNVPAGLTNIVAIAAGGGHCLALSNNGTVAAWGASNAGQCNVPAGLSNVMAIAAGWEHSLALKNDGTLVAWGANSNGQANLPNEVQSINVKMIAAGGDHTMAAIFNPTVQYQINVAQDLLLIYNSTNISLSSNVCAYYLAHRPMVSNANELGFPCPTNEVISQADFTNIFEPPILNWLAANPTKRPQFVILFQDFPSRIHNGAYAESVQVALNTINVSSDPPYITSIPIPGWRPFVTSINMNGKNGAGDCTAYIDKLAYFGSNYSPGKLIIGASSGGYGNTNWYFDFASNAVANGAYAKQGVTNVDPSASVIGSTYPTFITAGTNVAGYYSGGYDNDGSDTNMFVDGLVRFWGNSGWYIMGTTDSFSGQRDDGGVPSDFVQAGFLKWFARASFSGTNYSNTPVGGVTYVEEPSSSTVNCAVYYGAWAAGRSFAIAGWAGQASSLSPPAIKFQAVGDPFVRE